MTKVIFIYEINKKCMEQNQKLNTDTSIDPTKSYENGAWNNLKLIFQQQVPQYFISVEQGGGSRTIKDINGLLSFLESTINNSLNTFIKQSISISKLNKIEEPRVKRDINYTPTSQNSEDRKSVV